MRALRILLIVTFGVAAAFSCSLADSGSGALGSDAGGAAGGPTSCWPGEKWCSGECKSAKDDQAGCGSGSCEPCNLPHAIAACQGDSCQIEVCATNYEECDQDPRTGCEQNLKFDPKSCGACGNDCF